MLSRKKKRVSMEGNVIRESWMNVNRYLPTAMLLLVAIFWGTSYGIGKEALLFTTVVVFLVIRFLMTTLVLLPIVIYQRNYRNWTSVLPTGVVLFLIFVCETYGIKNTTASNAAFLISLFVVFTPVIEWVVNKKSRVTSYFYCLLFLLLGFFY